MPKVQSTVIRAYEYDRSAQVLYITFLSGKTYAYSRLLPEIFDALEAAPSKGEFFNEHIRGQYDDTLVTLPRQPKH